MKRMNEVFELPVFHNFLYVSYVSDAKDRVICELANPLQAQHVSRAINSVDKLADALAAALPSLQYNRSISDKADKLYLDAVAALNAYRGAK